MKEFIKLYNDLESTNSSNEKIDFILKYLEKNQFNDNAWTVYFLSNKKLKRTVSSNLLKEIFFEISDIDLWLFQECYEKVGGLSETISLLTHNKNPKGFEEITISDFCESVLSEIAKVSSKEKKNMIKYYWETLTSKEILIFNKFLSGNFRIGVSEKIVIKALAKYSKIEESRIMERLLGSWNPSKEYFEKLINKEILKVEGPYPFFLASSLDREFDKLGLPSNWLVEWKWDGIRVQAVKREEVTLWSRTLLTITNQFPDLVEELNKINSSFVIDGELVVYKEGKLSSFSDLKARLGRKNPNQKILKELPAKVICYDILEYNGLDLRNETLQTRREILKNFIKDTDIEFSKEIPFNNWDELEDLKNKSPDYTEGVMIKDINSAYLSGRIKGSWWKYKKEPYTVDAVLLYAEQGTGKRGGLFTNYTFGVWKKDQLVPFAKAYSGLTELEIKDLDYWIKSNTISKYGPIRSVKKEQIFEIAFENIDYSPRHKSGLAVRFPRIIRWRKDKLINDADKIEDLINLLKLKPNTGVE